MDEQTTLMNLKARGEAPQWLSTEGYITLSKGYILEDETPKAMYRRVADAACKAGGFSEDVEHDIFAIMYDKNWLGPASPVLSNMGTDRGLPISCFCIDVDDKMEDVMGRGIGELAMLTKTGGGVGVSMQRIRPRGTPIKKGKNGKAEGIIPFAKVYDSAILASKQGEVRRGSTSINLSIEHGDWGEFVRMRRPEGDINRQCLNVHHCATVSDEFMRKVKSGDMVARLKWVELLKTRIETGEPYIMFSDTVNRNSPDAYKRHGLEVTATNICCLTGDTLVATDKGAIKIEDLVNEDVTIYDGKDWVKNSSFSERGKTNELYEIRLKSGQKITTTANHRWFVHENYDDIRYNRLKEVTTENLKEGQFIEYHTEECHGKEKMPGAYLKGFLVGDGTYDKSANIPKLNLHFTKFGCENKLIESCKEVNGCETFRSDTIKQPEFSVEKEQVESNGVWGKQCFKSLKGLSYRRNDLNYWVTEAKQSLPNIILKWDKQTKLEFLSGLLDADGTYGVSIQITQKNHELIECIQTLVSTLGYSSSIDLIHSGSRLTIGSYDSYELFKLLDCKRLTCTVKKPNRRTTGYRQIVDIKKIVLNNPIPVYCPTVESTGKFALANGLMTGNSEITLYTDPFHSFVCCLSSLNLAEYDEWKAYKGERTGLSVPELAIYFLNGVLDEFINKASYLPFMENSLRSAIKGRALGLGVMGWHSLLLEKKIPFESFRAMQLNNEVFKFVKDEAVKASRQLATERGEPEWCQGTGMYNTHLLAVAPTKSNSVICGDVSAGIEPFTANAYTDVTGKGTFIRRSKHLQQLLEERGMNVETVWKSISNNNGSVQHLDFLSEEEKELYKTAYEIDQKALIQQAAQRQKYICQSQSLNVFFPFDVSPKYFNEVHLLAWELGVKTLYYCKSTSGISVDHKTEICKSCEG